MFKLSPSKAHRFLNCTKSLLYDTAFVETPSTIRGNILHKFAEMTLKNEDTREFIVENNIDQYEMFLISSYANEVWREYDQIFAYKMIIEEKHEIEIYGFKINLVIDCLLLGRDTASIIDLKSGFADVDPEENEQLLFYGYDTATKHPEIENYNLSIFQKGKMKTVKLTRGEIFDFFIDKYDVFEKIRKNELTYNPSEKACKYCGNKDKCIPRAEKIIWGKNETKEI